MGQYQELRLFKEDNIFVQVSAALLSNPHPRSDCSLRRSKMEKVFGKMFASFRPEKWNIATSWPERQGAPAT